MNASIDSGDEAILLPWLYIVLSISSYSTSNSYTINLRVKYHRTKANYIRYRELI